jgi:hypothetical protein
MDPKSLLRMFLYIRCMRKRAPGITPTGTGEKLRYGLHLQSTYMNGRHASSSTASAVSGLALSCS